MRTVADSFSGLVAFGHQGILFFCLIRIGATPTACCGRALL